MMVTRGREAILQQVEDDSVALPYELIRLIFESLGSKDLASVTQVCRQWQAVVNGDELLTERKIGAFGPVAWTKYFGNIGNAPALPKDIMEQLSQPCLIWPGKTVRETHVLVLIPSRVNGTQLTIESWGHLVENPLEGHDSKYRYKPVAHIGACADHNYWVLMSKCVLPGSRRKPYSVQVTQVEALAKASGYRYRVPKFIEATICLFTHHVKTGKLLFSAEPKATFTRCLEVAGFHKQMMVGHGESYRGDLWREGNDVALFIEIAFGGLVFWAD